MRQDIQDNQDIFCLSGRKAKRPIPLRGKDWFLDGAKVSRPYLKQATHHFALWWMAFSHLRLEGEKVRRGSK
jgi:hypothetical protein